MNPVNGVAWCVLGACCTHIQRIAARSLSPDLNKLRIPPCRTHLFMAKLRLNRHLFLWNLSVFDFKLFIVYSYCLYCHYSLNCFYILFDDG